MPSLSRRNALKIGGAAAAGAVIAPAVSNRLASAQDVTIKFWNGIFPVEDPNDKTKDKSEFYIYQAIDRFQTANPGVTVDIETVPFDPTMFTKFRTAGVAQNGPDVMSMWSGTYMLALSDFIEPLGSYFTTEERARIRGWEAVSPEFSADSPNIFGVPAGTDGICAVYYNNDHLTAAGINAETDWPTDFDSFVTMLDALKTSGIETPLGLESYGYLWFTLFYWIGQNIGGAQGFGELASGARKFNDPVILNIVQKWLTLAPYAAEGAPQLDGTAVNGLIASGEATMTVSGAWNIDDFQALIGESAGLHKLPDFNADAGIVNGGVGGSGTCLIVSNYSEQKELSVAFLKFLMSMEEQTLKAQSPEGGLVNVTDVDTDTIFTNEMRKMEQAWAYEPSTIFYADNTLQADLVTEISAQAGLAWTGAMSAEDFLQALDDKRDSLLS